MEKMQAHAYTTSLVPSFHSPAFLMRVKKSWAGNEAISTYHPFSIFLYLSTVYFISLRVSVCVQDSQGDQPRNIPV